MYTYTKDMYQRFKFKFDGLENIERNYSQALQDLFVLAVLDGKRNGTFLEIGAYHGTYLSNTYLLEKEFGWNGISVDIDHSAKASFDATRRTAKFILGDATCLDYDKILSETFDAHEISYLQIDVEPNWNSLKTLKQIPFDKWKFATLNFEHDHYSPEQQKEENDKIRQESEEILESYGYIAVAKNIENIGNDEFESWFCHPDLVSMDVINLFMLEDVNKPIRAKDYMLEAE